MAATENAREMTILLGEDGEAVLTRTGAADSVVWRESELLPLVGRVRLITHNHPRGTSLTPEDLAIAMFLNAQEVHAFTYSARFCLRRLGSEWPAYDEVFPQLSQLQADLEAEFSDRLAQGRLSPPDAERLFYRALWERLVRAFPDRLSYRQEQR